MSTLTDTSQSTPAHVTPRPGGGRSLALDALRGLAILLMCASALTPRWLPNFMYHGNNPQYQPVVTVESPAALSDNPTVQWERVDNPWAYDSRRAGMTWVDIVFPMFLFAMGAAIPLAFTSRLRADPSRWRQARAVLGRFVALVLFAVYVQQVLPGLIEQPVTHSTLCMSVLAFVALMPLLTRLPNGTPTFVRRLLRITGAVSAILVLCIIHTREGHAGFSWGTYDIIIMLLAWCSLVASLLWLLFPNRPWLWLAVGLVIAFMAHEINLPAEHRLIAGFWEPIESVLQSPRHLLDLRWIANPDTLKSGPAFLNLSSLYSFSFLSCLWLVLPGMLVGEKLSKASRSVQATEQASVKRTGVVVWTSVALLLAIGIVLVLAGLQDVDTCWGTWLGITWANPYAALLGLAPLLLAWLVLILSRTLSGAAVLVRNLVGVGVLCLLVGITLSCLPGINSAYFEGGVRKVPGTMSWYFASTGLICHLLAIFTIIIDIGRWRRTAALLIGTGQNPMLAYVASRNLLWPIFALPLIGWLPGRSDSFDAAVTALLASESLVDQLPWWEMVWGLIKVILLAGIIWAFTKRRVFWRV